MGGKCPSSRSRPTISQSTIHLYLFHPRTWHLMEALFQNLHPPTISSWLQLASRYTLNVSMLETLSYGVLSFSIFASDAPASYWFFFTASSSFPLSSPLFLFPPLIFRLPQRGRVSCFLAHMSKDCVKELSSHWTTI